jgi:uncharacterized protein YydD (DUF2326 family)
MSNEEQFSTVGRLIFERAEANKQRALLKSEIDSFSVKLSSLRPGSAGMSPRAEDEKEMERVLESLEVLIARGGLEKLKVLISEYLSLGNQLSRIQKTLKDAGAE